MDYKPHNDLITVAVHSGHKNELIDRMRAATHEKRKGALMIDRQKELFGFASYKEIETILADELKKEEHQPAKSTIKWERDRFGNPTRPHR